jgi:hypothetical protein
MKKFYDGEATHSGGGSETPAEKARRLDVTLISPAIVKYPEKEEKVDKGEYYKKMNKTVAVCGACGKEIKENHREEPCGKSDCPFGQLVM